MTSTRIAILALLGSTLAVTSCAALIGHRATRAAPDAAIASSGEDLLAARHLLIPVKGLAVARLRDNYSHERGGRTHQALDIMAGRGTPVIAADDGTIVKMRRHPLGGLSIHQLDPDRRFTYYYAHLGGYAPGLKVGHTVRRGEVIGFVGTTGNASPGAPHLHFAVTRVGADGNWYRGTPVNPYPYLSASQDPPG